MVNELDRSVILVPTSVKLSVARHATEKMYISYTRATTEGDLLRVQAQMNAARRLKEKIDTYNKNGTEKKLDNFMTMVVATDEQAKATLEQSIVQNQEKHDDDDQKLPAVEEKRTPDIKNTPV